VEHTTLTPRQEQLLDALRRWAKIHGDTRVRQADTFTFPSGLGYPLGSRVRSLRQSYKAGTLSREMISAVEALPGWSWSVRAANGRYDLPQEWRASCQALARYVADNGSTRGLEAASPSLRLWLITQRKRAAAGELNDAQLRELRKIPTINLDNDVPARGPERTIHFARSLGSWLVGQGRTLDQLTARETFPWAGSDVCALRRASYYRERLERLTPDEVQALEALPGWSWA